MSETEPTLTEAEKVEALAAVLDPDVFDDDKPKSSAHAALIQWAARRFMATEKAERAIAAGWLSPEEAKAREAAAWDAGFENGIDDGFIADNPHRNAPVGPIALAEPERDEEGGRCTELTCPQHGPANRAKEEGR